MWLHSNKNVLQVLFTFILINIILAKDDSLLDEDYNRILFNNEVVTTRIAHPDLYLTTPEMITRHGYKVEVHPVITDNGYILGIHRIPNIGKPPVFINHGFLGSSADFVVTGPGRALAYVLFDAGFDVWLGNMRGNVYSKNHTTIDNRKFKFWQFGIQESATIDLPTIIDYILKNTTNTALNYIGFSLGSMELFVLMSEKPEYNSKIRQMHAMAPVAYLGTLGRTGNWLKKYLSVSTWTMYLIGMGEFLPWRPLNSQLEKDCTDVNYNSGCMNTYTYLFTRFSKLINQTMLPIIVSHNPAGASARSTAHLGALMDIDKFRKYDYGAAVNQREYGQSTPPDYHLSKTTFPVYIYYADKDTLAAPHNVQKMSIELSNCKEKRLIQDPDFIHADFLFGWDAKFLVYDRIVSVLKM